MVEKILPTKLFSVPFLLQIHVQRFLSLPPTSSVIADVCLGLIPVVEAALQWQKIIMSRVTRRMYDFIFVLKNKNGLVYFESENLS